jgi:hypothetical protein
MSFGSSVEVYLSPVGKWRTPSWKGNEATDAVLFGQAEQRGEEYGTSGCAYQGLDRMHPHLSQSSLSCSGSRKNDVQGILQVIVETKILTLSNSRRFLPIRPGVEGSQGASQRRIVLVVIVRTSKSPQSVLLLPPLSLGSSYWVQRGPICSVLSIALPLGTSRKGVVVGQMNGAVPEARSARSSGGAPS